MSYTHYTHEVHVVNGNKEQKKRGGPSTAPSARPVSAEDALPPTRRRYAPAARSNPLIAAIARGDGFERPFSQRSTV